MQVIVVGGGEHTYRNLCPSLKALPDLGMRLHTLIDVVPQNKLQPEMQKILHEDCVRYLSAASLIEARFWKMSEPVAFVVTPNAYHLEYVEFFTRIGIPVYVEKPVVSDCAALKRFLEVASANPRLIYASEHCTDARALGLLEAAGLIKKDDPRLDHLVIESAEKQAPADLFQHLGTLQQIRGKMLEGVGTASVADHRSWLFDGRQGGMIRDLAPHLFGPLYDLGYATADVIDPYVSLGRWEEDSPRGTFRPLTVSIEGETYAKITGTFSLPKNRVPFTFEVGKYWEINERVLALDFENGQVTLYYDRPFQFTIKLRNGSKAESRLSLNNPYPLVLLDFKQFLRRTRDGHIARAAEIVRFNERMRQVGITQACLS